ncbi:MAG: DMT family transporter [Myxococcota bacterium]|nr:DMT family transporter [Myxococcota bacterium]
MTETPADRGVTKRYLLLFSIALIWGSQFLLNHLALEVFTPQAISWLRAAIGCFTLSLFIPFVKESRPASGEKFVYWRQIVLVGFFEATLPFFLVAWGQQHVNSAVASILMSLVAVFTLVLVVIFVREEPITAGKILGILIGFGGVLVLLWPQLDVSIAGSSLLGSAAILAAALSFAISLILIRRLPQVDAPLRTARNILFCGAIELGLLLLFMAQPLAHHALESGPVAAMAFQGVLAGGLVYVLYVSLVAMAGAAFAGFANYLIPVVGVFLGVVFLHDHVSSNAYASLVILALAIVISEWKPRRLSGGRA